MDHANIIRTEFLYGDRLVSCFAERPKNLDDLLRSIARRYPKNQAFVEDGNIFTYRQLDEAAERIAANLRQAGISPGERVVLFIGNRIEFVLTIFGALRMGAIVVPIGIRQTSPELTYMINQCGATAVIYEAALIARLPALKDIPSVLRLWTIEGNDSVPGEEFQDLLEPIAPRAEQLDIDEQSAAFIMYTSGTTGRPKGAMLSHLGFFHTAKNYERSFGYCSQSRMILAIPGSHISGLLAGIFVMIQVGGCTVIMREFKTRPFLQLIEKERITCSVMVPAMYNLCILEPDLKQYDLSTWTLGHFGGAAMPEVTIERLAQAVPQMRLYNGFGATETTSAVTLTTSSETVQFPESVGKVLDCIEVKVLDELGREVLPGLEGELWVRSPGNAIGYWNNPEATREGFVGGYWRSGDIGSIDEHGRMRVLDRKKDMINRGGYKVYSVEVENVLQRFPGVIEAAVVPVPCPILGERVRAVIYASQAVTLAELREFCSEHLADYKWPDQLIQFDAPLPRNLNGKMSKQALRKQLSELDQVPS
ncbi:MAG: class I adenylate-forming enzyme family protein [Proteobacteria bacterium]|nr:class I adenylate-forming enzyme family protein [Pseudomonadota bacterium]